MTQKQTQEHTLYHEGLRAHQSGDWLQAERFYRQALILCPDWAIAHYSLGVVFDQQYQLAAAAQHYETAIALEPDYAQAIENLGCVYLKQGRTDPAIVQLRRAIALKPHQASLWNNLGQALYANRHQGSDGIQHAIEAYEQALKLDPDLIIVHINLGLLFQDQRNDENAIAHFRAVLEHEPDHVTAHSHCARLYLRQGRIKLAIEHWQHLATQQSHLLRPYCYQVYQDSQKASLHTDNADGLRQDGLRQDDLLQAVKLACAKFLYGLLQKSPASETGRWLQQTYEYLGQLLMQEVQGEDLAEFCFRQALSISPSDPTLLLYLADCLSKQKRFDAATMLYSLCQPAASTRSHPAPQPKSPIKAPKGAQRDIQRDAQSYESIPLRQIPTSTWAETTDIPSFQYQAIAWPGADYPEADAGAAAREQVSAAAVVETDENSPCGGVTCSRCMSALRQSFEPCQIAENVYQCGAFNREMVFDKSAFQTFVVTIPQGRAWVAPYQNAWKICNSVAVITPDQALLSDISRDYPWRLPGCRHEHRHRSLKLGFTFPALERLNGRVAVLSGLSGHVYYHWMMDIVPRFGLLKQAGWNDIDTFVVNSLKQPFQHETLEMLGIPKHKIVESDRHPHIQADELIVPSFPGPLDWPPLSTLNFLRATFLQDLEVQPSSLESSPEPYPPYFYVSRANADYRRILNEDQVIKVLKPLGFVPITLETLSVKQQAKLFANATVIVAPHGAGLTNTVFCSPDTHIVELTSPRYIRTDYWIVSHHLKLHHYCIKGEGVECPTLRQLMYQNPLTEDIWIPSATLKAMITLVTRIVTPLQGTSALSERRKTDG